MTIPATKKRRFVTLTHVRWAQIDVECASKELLLSQFVELALDFYFESRPGQISIAFGQADEPPSAVRMRTPPGPDED